MKHTIQAFLAALAITHAAFAQTPTPPVAPPAIIAGKLPDMDRDASAVIYPSDKIEQEKLLLKNGNFSEPSLNGKRWDTFEGIEGWTAIEGDLVEIQKIFPSKGQYCELDSHWEDSSHKARSDHGIKQPVWLSPGHYVLVFDYRARNANANDFIVKALPQGGREVRLVRKFDAAEQWKRAYVSFDLVDAGAETENGKINVTLKFDITDPADSYGALIDNVMLLPMPVETRIVNRDNPRKPWQDNALMIKPAPVYSGKSTGDMISWKVGGSDRWAGASYSWRATGPETKAGPSGAGKNEWKIAKDGDKKPGCMDWKPGKYQISCDVTLQDGSKFTVGSEQEVGTRTDHVVVIGWINPKTVPLDDTGVQKMLKIFLPKNGLNNAPDETQLTAAKLLEYIGEKDIESAFDPIPYLMRGYPSPLNAVNFDGFSDKDKMYTINWIFKFAANIEKDIPSSFFDEAGNFDAEAVSKFVTKKTTSYKLVNQFQVRFLVDAEGFIRKNSIQYLSPDKSAYIGSTLDPTCCYQTTGFRAYLGKWAKDYPAGGAFPGKAHERNADLLLSKFSVSQINAGVPDSRGLAVEKKLTGKDQGVIWSTVDFVGMVKSYNSADTISESTGLSLTCEPKRKVFSDAKVNAQAYPTYWIYVNGQLLGERKQADTPMALFPNIDVPK